MTFLSMEGGKNLDESNFYGKVKNISKDCLNETIICELCGKFFKQKNGCLLILSENIIPANLIKPKTEKNASNKKNFYKKMKNSFTL